MPRKPYTTDVSDEEWSFTAPYLTLMDQHAPQRENDLREVFNTLGVGLSAEPALAGCGLPRGDGLGPALQHSRSAGSPRSAQRRSDGWAHVAVELRERPECGLRRYKRKRGSKVHMAVDTLGHLRAVHVTPADEQERAQVQRLCEDMQ